jgi:cyclic pyranopterin phosphate synthase
MVDRKEFHGAIITRNLLLHGWYNLLMTSKLNHIDDNGRAHMVDVGDKADTERFAIACGEVVMKRTTFDEIRKGNVKKGDVLTIAQIAGITAAKRTFELIPLSHPLLLSYVDVTLSLDEKLPGVAITASVKTRGKTGVEMEALTAVSIAALTVYDMAKAVEKTMKIQNIRLIEKHGGRSGDIINEMRPNT